MAQPNRGKLVAAFQLPIRVEVRQPKFVRSASLAYIDAAKLARAAHAEFEVGHFDAGCCRRPVVAVVRRRMVTALRVEACAECKPVRLTAEAQAVLNAARRRMGRREKPFRPMPVAQFLSGVSGIIVWPNCYWICITTSLCLFCCDYGGRFPDCSIIRYPEPGGGHLA